MILINRKYLKRSKLGVAGSIAGLTLGLVLGMATIASAPNASAADGRVRKIVGVFGEHWLGDATVSSFNLGVNVTQFARLQGGMVLSSSLAGLKIYNAGVNFLVPGWRLSPMLGVHLLIVHYSTELFGESISITGTDVVIPAGLDFSYGILNLGGGVYLSPSSSLNAGSFGVMPFAHLGLYFGG